MNPPKYNIKTQTLNEYLREVDAYKLYLIKDKYNIILNFLNELMDKKINSLTDFKNVDEEILLKNKQRNNDALIKYTNSFKDKFNVKINDYDNIINILSRLLPKIQYTLLKISTDNKIIYTIKYK